MSIVPTVRKSEFCTSHCRRARPLVASQPVTLRHRSKSAGFPARLKEARREAGLTGAQLGEKTGLTKQGVSGLEAGRQGCTTALCERLAKALGVAPAQLAYGMAVDGGTAVGYGQRIRQARGQRSLESVAQRLGYRDRSSIAHMEAERQLLDLALAEVLARELEVSPAWLAFGVLETETRTLKKKPEPAPRCVRRSRAR